MTVDREKLGKLRDIMTNAYSAYEELAREIVPPHRHRSHEERTRAAWRAFERAQGDVERQEELCKPPPNPKAVEATLRDDFAIKLAAAIIAGGWADTVPYDDVTHAQQLAAFAYAGADAMLDRRRQ